ncbi:hypothetical protein RQN30_10720 [Arcanobacterium hippocoleae]
MEETNIEIEQVIDQEKLAAFINSMTNLEIQIYKRASGKDFSDLSEDDYMNSLSAFVVVAANRLGHTKITKADIDSISFLDQFAILDKAASIKPFQNKRTRDLLAEVSK